MGRAQCFKYIQTSATTLAWWLSFRGRKADGERNEVKKEMRCQVDCMGSQRLLQPDHWDYKKNETSQRTSSHRGINIRWPNLWPPSQSFLPLFPLLHLLVPAARRHADFTQMSAREWSTSPQRGTQKNLPTILWQDKWSRLIVCLDLMAWQLIKALQGCIMCSVPLFLC